MDAAQVGISDDKSTLICSGSWTINDLSHFIATYKNFLKSIKSLQYIDATQLSKMDSAGAAMFCEVLKTLQQQGHKITVKGMKRDQTTLLKLVSNELNKELPIPTGRCRENIIYRIGEWGVEKVDQFIEFTTFTGELSVSIIKACIHTGSFYWRGVLNSLDDAGLRALPILALMSFLIGIVLAYQLGVQLEEYGANIYIVDFSGIAMLREFGPLITAVIMAGRTSTAFAALIGTMKVNEEIDALQTMGVTPIERLVMPRIIALIFIFPLLIIWSDAFGVLGSMIMAKAQLSIGYVAFLNRFSFAVGLKQYVLGLVKGPFFAIIIASIGCFQGFQVKMNADSVGEKTTHAAVQALFLIIIADAFFSIFYNVMGW